MSEVLLQDDTHRLVPIIDIASLRQDNPSGCRAVAEQFRKACTSTGFFYIAHHGVAAALRSQLFAEAKRFFRQSQAMKERSAIIRGEGQNGYSGIGSQRFDPGIAADNKESMYIGVEHPIDFSSVFHRSWLARRCTVPIAGPGRCPAGARRF
jgi:isopenicillin N synthase-like dioxygenase